MFVVCGLLLKEEITAIKDIQSLAVIIKNDIMEDNTLTIIDKKKKNINQ